MRPDITPERALARTTVALALSVAALTVFGLDIVAVNVGVVAFSRTAKVVLFAVAAVAAAASGGWALFTAARPSRRVRVRAGDPGSGGSKDDDTARELGYAGVATSAPPASTTPGSPERQRVAPSEHRRIGIAVVLLALAIAATTANALGKPPATLAIPRSFTEQVRLQVDIRGGKVTTSGSHGAGLSVLGAGAIGAIAGLAGFAGVAGSLENTTIGDIAGALLKAIANGHLTIAPTIDIGGAKLPAGALTALTDCAAYFVDLDDLADDEPKIGPWLDQTHDPTAKACGLASPKKLNALIAYLAKR